MPKKSRIPGNPAFFMEAAMLAWERKPIPPILTGGENESYSLLHRFNRFRNILVDEGHDFALASKDLIVRRKLLEDGNWYLTFTAANIFEDGVFQQHSAQPIFAATLPGQKHKGQEEFERRSMPNAADEFFDKMMEEARRDGFKEKASVPLATVNEEGVHLLTPEDLAALDLNIQGEAQQETGASTEKKELLTPAAIERTLQKDEATERLEARISQCTHEWELYGSCKHCSVSKVDWEAGTWKTQ